MFDVVRNNKKIVQLFLALITLPFAFFGVESYIRSAGVGGDLAKVGDVNITEQQFQQAMRTAGDERVITTEIAAAKPFYYAEDEHQQYLHKNPYGYCGIGGIGVCLPPQLQG